MKVAITGKIAAGKSTAVEKIKNLLPDYVFISADDIARKIRQHEKIKAMLIAEHGTDDPAVLRTVIATSKSIRYITDQVKTEIADIVRDNENIVAEVPTLLNGLILPTMFDKILFITVPLHIQKERLKARKYSDQEIHTFLSQQQFTEQDERITDIINNMDINYLEYQLMLALRQK